MKRQWARQTGFTIVELLIVIVVIAILAAITIVAFNGIQERSRTSRVNSEFASIKKAMLSYKAINNELPPVGDAWNYNTNPPSCPTWDNVKAALLNAGIGGTINATDPWGNCYGYDDNDCNTSSPVGSTTQLRSGGPDGLTCTADDISLLVVTKEAC